MKNATIAFIFLLICVSLSMNAQERKIWRVDNPSVPWVAPSNEGGENPGRAQSSPARLSTMPLKTYTYSGLNLHLDSYSAGLFPFVFVNFSALVDSMPASSLTISNFVVTENDAVQTISQFQPPSTSGGSKAADIVIVFDDTGSMGSQIASCRDNVITFADSLQARGIDYRLGLVTYKDDVTIRNDGNLTADKALFESWIAGLYASGGGDEPENLFDALGAALGYNFRPGVQKIFIVITDADAHYGGDGSGFTTRTLASVESLLVASSVVVNVAGPDINQYDGVGSLTASTGGQWFYTTSPLTTLLDKISTRIANQYVLSYRSSVPVLNGTQRNVKIIGDVSGKKDTLKFSYTPGTLPQIVRTSSTIALSTIPQLPGTPDIAIQAWVIDHFPPYVDKVNLYYARADTTTLSFTNLPMSKVNDSLWSATLPSSALASPGLSYYITAADSASSISDPLVDPSTHPYMISVLPNKSPIIIHDPIRHVTLPIPDLTINATVIDSTHFVKWVELGYRQIGTLTYTLVEIPLISGTNQNGMYKGTIPSAVSGSTGSQYFLMASDDFGVISYVGTMSDPIQAGIDTGTTAIPDPPFLVLPADSSAGITLSPTLIWTASPKAASYGIQVSTSSSFSTMAVNINGIVTTSYQVPAGRLSGSTFYYWRVNATNSSGTSSYSSIAHFVTAPAGLPDVPVLGWPADSAVGIPLVPTLTWTVSSKAMSYGLQLSDSATFRRLLVDEGSISTNSYQVPLGKLLGNTRYFWRVNAKNSFGVSSFSTAASFVTEAQVPLSLRPTIRGIFDVPNDNGSQVFVRWTVDKPAVLNDIVKFSVWRRDAPNEWTYVTDVPALNDTLYRVVAPTIYDSTKSKGLIWSIFRVSAHSATAARYSMSNPDSGYSLDNIFPSVPSGVGGVTNGINTIVLKWNPVPDNDLQYYKVYRDIVSGFAISDSKLIKKVSDTTFTDNGVTMGNRYYYRIAAVDFSGNEGTASVEFSMKVTSVREEVNLPLEYALDNNYPNPFNPSTTIRFALPVRSAVTLEVINTLGQVVATLVREEKDAGYHEVVWNANMASGTYFFRIRATGINDANSSFFKVNRMVLLK